MDVKNKPFYAHVKIHGVSELIKFNGQHGVAQTLMLIAKTMMDSPARYGPGSITFDFKPIQEHMTELEKFQAECNQFLNSADIPFEDESDPLSWANSPMNHESSAHDPIFAEYMKCGASMYRARKTPEDLAILRKHAEENYRGSPWWQGYHSW